MAYALLHTFIIIGIENYANSKNQGLVGYASTDGYKFTCDCTSVSSSVCIQLQCSLELKKVSCFAGNSTVRLSNGKIKSLFELEIGEQVLVDAPDIYEPVTTFIHGQHEGYHQFLEMNIQSTKSNQSSILYVSPNHLLFDYDKKYAVLANQFEIGQRVMYVDNGETVAGRIHSIRITHEKGFFAPLTPSGKIVIDDVVASNYASVSNHNLAHSLMNVYRWFLKITGSQSVWGKQIPVSLEFLSAVAKPIDWIGQVLNWNSL